MRAPAISLKWQRLQRYDLLQDEYFPFYLYSEFKRGETIEALAIKYSLGLSWVKESIEAARLCIENEVRIERGWQHG